MHLLRILSLLSIVMLVTPSLGHAERFKTISTKDLLLLQQSGQPFLLIDALSSIEFKALHIKDSINIPASHVDAHHPLLPEDKETRLVFYCKGVRCTKSRLAARKSMQLGYTHVLIYSGGLPAWQKAGLPMVSSHAYPEIDIKTLNPLQVYQQQKPFILDIRGTEVSRMGNIPGALKIPLDDLEQHLAKLPCTKPIIIIDHAGQQAPICARFLHSNGYTDLFILEGGMINWIRQGFPTR